MVETGESMERRKVNIGNSSSPAEASSNTLLLMSRSVLPGGGALQPELRAGVAGVSSGNGGGGG
jgi:hypothetical protein